MRICQTLHKLQLNLKPQLCPIFNFFVMKKKKGLKLEYKMKISSKQLKLT